MSRVLTREEIDALLAQEPYVPAPMERYRVVVEAGTAELRPEEVTALKVGALIRLEQSRGAPVPIVANGVLVGRGELTSAGGKVAVRITSLNPPAPEPRRRGPRARAAREEGR